MSQQHKVSFERDTYDTVDSTNQWVQTFPAGTMRVTCSCGLDTGTISEEAAKEIMAKHQVLADS